MRRHWIGTAAIGLAAALLGGCMAHPASAVAVPARPKAVRVVGIIGGSAPTKDSRVLSTYVVHAYRWALSNGQRPSSLRAVRVAHCDRRILWNRGIQGARRHQPVRVRCRRGPTWLSDMAGRRLCRYALSLGHSEEVPLALSLSPVRRIQLFRARRDWMGLYSEVSGRGGHGGRTTRPVCRSSSVSLVSHRTGARGVAGPARQHINHVLRGGITADFRGVHASDREGALDCEFVALHARVLAYRAGRPARRLMEWPNSRRHGVGQRLVYAGFCWPRPLRRVRVGRTAPAIRPRSACPVPEGPAL